MGKEPAGALEQELDVDVDGDVDLDVDGDVERWAAAPHQCLPADFYCNRRSRI